MSLEKIDRMRKAHEILCEFPFEIKELFRGYSDRILRIDLDKNEISTQPVTQQMKDLWTGGKGFDLWMMFQEVSKNTKWDSPENPICFSPGPLGGTTSFPGSGKTLVTALSPITQSVMDCNVGGFFGPYMKFAGFDVLVIRGKAKQETIIVVDAVKKKITIETAPLESIDSHILAEELTEMYAEDDLDKRNIAVVSAGQAAIHSRMGVLNFSFWDWRRNVARLKQAGRGGVGTVFRDKQLKALIIKNKDITPAWRVQENKAAKWVKPTKITIQPKHHIPAIDAIIEKWGNDREYTVEIMQDIQERFHMISNTAMDRINLKTGIPKAYIYHIATFDKYFTLQEKATPTKTDLPQPYLFLCPKSPVILHSTGTESPENIEQYMARGGYDTLKKILASKKPGDIIIEVKKSGLRGRSGGFSVGQKWEAALNASKEKNKDIYVVCTTGESDRWTGVDHAILETHPHAVIEGLITGGYAVGAKEGFITLRKDKTDTPGKLLKAIEEAQKAGFLGEKIHGSDFSFYIHVHPCACAAVGGESSSIIAAMSGKAGDSQPKYVPTTEIGFRGNPTILNTAETWANIPVIMEKGIEKFAASHTKVFFLSGDTRNPGFVEVTMGTTLREIVETIGGGTASGQPVKAVQVGGPWGGFVPSYQLHIKADFDPLAEAGTLMGTGDIIVMDDTTCIMDKIHHLAEYLLEESCGKCTPCREGLYAIKNTLDRICSGNGKTGDLEFIKEVSETMKDTSLCRFGTTASNPFLTALKWFKTECESHIGEAPCKACQSE